MKVKVITEKEIAVLRNCPEDSTTPPLPETLPVFVPVTTADYDLRDYQEQLAQYHMEFLFLAKQQGYQVSLPNSIESPVREEEFILVTDIYQDASLLERDLDAFCEHVREKAKNAKQGYKRRQGVIAMQFLSEYSRDPRCTIKRVDFNLLDNIMAAHKYGAKNASNLSVATDMGLIVDSKNQKLCKTAEKKVARWRKKALSLIEAAAKGDFVKELGIALDK